MKDLGMSLSTGINSFAKGLEMGERWKSKMDDDAWNAEVKNRQRSEWKASDDLRAKQAQAQQLQAAYEAIQSGIDIDPAPILAAMQQAGQFGASVAQHFAEPEKMQGWLQAADQVMKTGQGSPEALEALNWRLQDQVNKGVGEELKQPVVLDDAHVVPAGSKIVGKRISQVVPSRSKDGLYFGLDVEVETPDGKRMTYPAPATVGRDSSPDAQILEVPLEDIFDLVEADRLVMSDVQKDPKFAGALRAMILASGGKVPTAPKREEFKREIGDEIVTFQRMPDGTEKEVARAPRWNPKPAAQRDRRPTTIEEYRGLVNEVGQEEADRIWSGAKGRGSRDLPLSPNQVITQAGAARRAATTYVENRAKSDFKLGRDQAAQKQLLADVYAEELAARGLDQTMVDAAAQQTGKRSPRAVDAPAAADETGDPDDAELMRLWGQ